ncbi:Fic family protein [Pseudoalteromonas piscicida]|uniref:Fic family protein n=1 Tax=Pseudoalteromonas piscicida TaxID=43662 RepID=A0AAQ2IQI1_PSEO7|nr:MULTISPECIES: Fic family protein [Pseudoalteromonas]KJY89234.1 hypothetical protein TW75_09980 [Pseudoalteromonas piscicida]TMN37016.1 Fic family protein [Pseudoalteromonas piscicida]TMN42394.1 Fic family protein [Pseudoalteromonas piscicida]TMN53031.1 Fic family protein [Pseudoalteromonas piscicida]TMN55503.1 Fic family protein [Pseudoalteromonas piscicida]
MEYSNIVGMPSTETLQKLRSTELKALTELWHEKKGELENSGEYRNFIKKMQREWAIETGIIERLYTWDRGVTETLIEQGIDASLISHGGGISRDEAENIAKMIKDQQDIVEGLFAFIKGDQPFSEHFIRSMHERLTAHQHYTEAMTADGKLVQVGLLKGRYKEQPNNPKRRDGTIHEYCPPELVSDEMEMLVKLYLEYDSKIEPEILSAWLHHKFTQIHPFQDGNGRIARAIASLVFLKAGLFPLVIRDSDREDYISALEEADSGDLSPLVRLFAKRQRNSVLSALGIQQQVVQAKHSKQIISNAIALLMQKSRAQKAQIKSIYNVADKLHEIVKTKILDIQGELDAELRNIETTSSDTYNASFKSANNGDESSHYFRRQIIDMAKEHSYYANTESYKSWSRLIIFTGSIFEVVFSIHGYGHEDNGVMVVSGFTFEKIPSEDGSEHTDTKPSHPDLFQFNYLESESDITIRFEDWLEEAITFSLAEWQKTLV